MTPVCISVYQSFSILITLHQTLPYLSRNKINQLKRADQADAFAQICHMHHKMIRCCRVVILVRPLIVRMSHVVVVSKSSPGYEVVRIAISGLPLWGHREGEAINFSCNFIVITGLPFHSCDRRCEPNTRTN